MIWSNIVIFVISEKRFCEIVQERGFSLSDIKVSQACYSRIDRFSSSVLVVVHYRHDQIPSVILTKRSSKLRNHAGEISFPGGRSSPKDNSFLETAIRETFEEIGLLVQKEQIIGCLTPINTYTTNMLIHPFIAILGELSLTLVPNEEVEKIIEIPVAKLRNSMVLDVEHSKKGNMMFKFLADEYVIWGATARILKDLFDLLETN